MKKIISLAFVLLLASNASADLRKGGEVLCAKIKSCAEVAIDKENLSSEEREVILSVFDKPCLASVQKYETDLGAAGLELKARSCLKSLTEKSCAILISGTEPVTTPVCTEFENAAKAAGITLGE